MFREKILDESELNPRLIPYTSALSITLPSILLTLETNTDTYINFS